MAEKDKLKSDLKDDISLELKRDYLRRLSNIYIKNYHKKVIFDQFQNGDGSELKWKFWEGISSSKLAFDLYSSLINDESVKDFELEYILPGIIYKEKETGASNMDKIG